MPPKKKEQPKAKPLIGRVGTSLKCGIVGLPNVGKSTFFNVLTKSTAAAENFPFCTIDPNESRVPVPDERFDFLCNFYKPPSKIPAFLKVVDIAGLVKGAHEGQGLGNAFLSNISACDAIFHMTRAFEDEDVSHVEGDVNPVRDMEIIFDELRLKDIEYLNDRIQDVEKKVTRGGDKSKRAEYDTLIKIHKILDEEKKAVRFCDWTANEIEILNKHLLLTSKPMIYLINLSEKDFLRKKNKWLVKMKEWIDTNDPGAPVIPFSGLFEMNLLEKTDEEREAYIKEKNCSSVLPKIITTGFRALTLQYFFTTGEDEVRAWTIQKGTKAPQAAGRVHGDFEKGFIMAEVMKYDDFKELGSEAAVKAAGKYRQQGRNYVVEDGDIVLFKANTAAGLTEKKKK
ncbi:obg-like ATPase 1 [Ptychodera flava]|uniref:obg-like ATPase 1 n=1 Tax=Ptychodera flava TaxID=63121 RepID=UPI00396A6E1F